LNSTELLVVCWVLPSPKLFINLDQFLDRRRRRQRAPVHSAIHIDTLIFDADVVRSQRCETLSKSLQLKGGHGLFRRFKSRALGHIRSGYHIRLLFAKDAIMAAVKRSGFADTPLHGGTVPAWLASRMMRLGTAIVESILLEYGHAEFLSRLSDPFWFQALGCVMGMDWHSSGVTTSVMSALKRGLNPRASQLGLHVCGGRGKQSRRTPAELRLAAEREGFNGEALVRTSRLTAKIDNNCIADGFQIYLHSFVVASSGEWTVVQQGMNTATGFARRYHWHSAAVRDFVEQPHTAERLLRQSIHELGGPAIHNGSDDHQRSFDSTCRKLHRFLES
jgi:hypothetical protein